MSATEILVAPRGLAESVFESLAGESWPRGGYVAEIERSLVAAAVGDAIQERARPGITRRGLLRELARMAQFLEPYEVGSGVALHITPTAPALDASVARMTDTARLDAERRARRARLQLRLRRTRTPLQRQLG